MILHTTLRIRSNSSLGDRPCSGPTTSVHSGLILSPRPIMLSSIKSGVGLRVDLRVRLRVDLRARLKVSLRVSL